MSNLLTIADSRTEPGEVFEFHMDDDQKSGQHRITSLDEFLTKWGEAMEDDPHWTPAGAPYRYVGIVHGSGACLMRLPLRPSDESDYPNPLNY